VKYPHLQPFGQQLASTYSLNDQWQDSSTLYTYQKERVYGCWWDRGEAGPSGDVAHTASRLGNAGINIKYGYSGAEPGKDAMFVIFGVAEAGKAAKILEKAAAASPGTWRIPAEVQHYED
jgi:hypothetical protein